MQWLHILLKEARIGIFNGLAVALTTSLGVLLWSRSIGLAFIIGISMILSMFIASIAGAAVPLILSACKQDPAQSSSVVLTTITDVTGFFSFLGIATLLSSLLQ
jgi:magnesium transporter